MGNIKTTHAGKFRRQKGGAQRQGPRETGLSAYQPTFRTYDGQDDTYESIYHNTEASDSFPPKTADVGTLCTEESNRLEAVFPFSSKSSADRSFEKGNQFEILSESSPEDGWCLAKNITVGYIGNVPKDYLARPDELLYNDWYHGKICAMEARLLLQESCGTTGSFLVWNKGLRTDQYVLSVLHGNKHDKSAVRHYDITELEYGYSLSHETEQFPSVTEVISHYTDNTFDRDCKLRTPCPRRPPPLPDLSSEMRDVMEIPRNDVSKVVRLAAGNFSTVWQGFWKGTVAVAIKQLKGSEWLSDSVVEEVKIAKALKHPNIVHVYGMSSATPKYIVMELMEQGNLRDYLRDEDGLALHHSDLLDIGKQIVSGMAYIEEKKFVHRNLAARNVLIGRNNSVKVADFGLVRAIEEDYHKGFADMMFAKWTAPESMKYDMYSIKSDVWSFGIVLVEIITYGEVPYKDLSNMELGTRLQEGYVHDQPAGCPDELYSIMKDCWALRPKDRPGFKELVEELNHIEKRVVNTVEPLYLLPAPPPEIAANNDGAIIMIALYNYTSEGAGDLAFRKGDKFAVIELNEGAWHFARDLETGKEGHIPSNFFTKEDGKRMSDKTFDWYLGTTNRTEAEQMLRDTSNVEGAFLIREIRSGGFALSMLSDKEGKVVKHYRIRDEGGLYIQTNVIFDTLAELVQHYKEHDGLVCFLTMPCRRTRPIMPDLSSQNHGMLEIPRESLQVETKLAAGNFGVVWQGVWNGKMPVAIKVSKPGAMSPETFLEEAKIMKSLDHPNLVKLYGVCSEEPIYIVTELMEDGSLLEYLRQDEGPANKMSLVDTEYMALQIAAGMEYLEERNYIHRDLAARNILVSGYNTVKIADFGLARALTDSEYVSKGSSFPVKWTAPEAIKQSKFSIKSDVWSYGIVLLEIVTNGCTPYPGRSNHEVTHYVSRGGRHERPDDCTEELYDVMFRCWEKHPSDRPSFAEIVKIMETRIKEDSDGFYEYLDLALIATRKQPAP